MTTSLSVAPVAPAAPNAPSRPDAASPNQGFREALGRAVDRTARPMDAEPRSTDAAPSMTEVEASEEAAEVPSARLHEDRASEQGRNQRAEHASQRADHVLRAAQPEVAPLHSEANVDADVAAPLTDEPVAAVGASPSLVEADLGELVPALADEVGQLLAATLTAEPVAEATAVAVPAPKLASGQPEPSQDFVVSELSTPTSTAAEASGDEAAVGTALPVAPLGTPPGGDLQAGPDVGARATVQPERAAASSSPGPDAGSMTAAPDGAATQVAAEVVAELRDQGRPAAEVPTAGDRAVRSPDGAPVLLEAEDPRTTTTPSGRVLPEQAVANGLDRDAGVPAPATAAGTVVDSAPAGTDQLGAVAAAPASALAAPASALALDGATPAAGTRGSGVVQRLADVARALENAPPPRSVVIDIESMRGLRLEIRLGEAGAVHVLAQGSSEAVQPLASLGRDLADALGQRGMHLGDFQAKEDDGQPGAGEADAESAEQRQNAPRRPVIRPGAQPLPASGRTLTGLRL